MGSRAIHTMSRVEQMLGAMKSVFDAVDKNKNGTLEKEELVALIKGVMTAMGQAEQIAMMPPEMADEMMNGMIEQFGGHDGAITWEDFEKKASENITEEQRAEPSAEEFAHGVEILGKVAAAIDSGDFSALPALGEEMNSLH